MLKKLDHIAIAVHNVEHAAKFYQDMLGLELRNVELIKEQKTRVGFLTIGETSIELVEPSCEDSPIAKFLSTKGPGIHHFCFEVDDIEQEIEKLTNHGAQLIDKIPRSGAHETLIAFLHPKGTGGVLIELCQKTNGQDLV
jgi:methylmalonyl-CoA/ethylmalonyl-CoA epimerase